MKRENFVIINTLHNLFIIQLHFSGESLLHTLLQVRDLLLRLITHKHTHTLSVCLSLSVEPRWTSHRSVAEAATYIYTPSGIRTRDYRNLDATNLRFRPQGHWDKHVTLLLWLNPNILHNNELSSSCNIFSAVKSKQVS